MITVDINNCHVRHLPYSLQNSGAIDSRFLNWRCLAAIFVIQFLYSQLLLSYGTYTVYLVEHNVKIMEAIWPLAVYIGSCKICNVFVRSIIKQCYKNHFRLLMFSGTLISSVGLSSCIFITSSELRAVFYGAFGGVGTSLVMNLIRSRVSKITPHQSQVLLAVQHVGIALGLLSTPHLLNLIMKNVTISGALLLHGAIILHALPAGLILYKKDTGERELTVYVNTGDLYEEEMSDMSTVDNEMFDQRNWRSPSDNLNFKGDEEEAQKQNTSTTVEKQKTNLGVEVLPQILEEDEELDENINDLRKSNIIVNDNIRKMSVISIQLEELIHHEEEKAVVKRPSADTSTNSEKFIRNYKTSGFVKDDETQYAKNECMCCRNCTNKCHIRNCLEAVSDIVITPVFFSFSNVTFYLSFFTNLHSMISPLIFFNFLALKAFYLTHLTVTECLFLFSITAFAYLAFIITLPWVLEISKPYFKYLYISGCVISSFGIYLLNVTQNDNYMTIGCLIYGFGFGIEAYLKENVIAYSFGAFKWSQIEGTLECLSGIFFIVAAFYIKDLYLVDTIRKDYIETWFNVLLLSHILVAVIWSSIPILKHFLRKHLKCLSRL